MPWWPPSPDRENGQVEALSLRRPVQAPRGPSCDNGAVQERCSRGGASGPEPCPWPGEPNAWRRRGPGWPRPHRHATWACPRTATQGSPGGLDGVEGVGLAGPPAVLAIGSVDFDDLDAHSAQVAGKARAIRTRALHADLDDFAEGLEPAQQRLVAVRVGGKALCAKQSTEWIERGGHVDVTVCVDTTSDPAELLRWSWSSLLLTELGMARPFRIGATGGPGCW